MTTRIFALACLAGWLIAAAGSLAQTPVPATPLTRPGEAPAAQKQPAGKAVRPKLYDEAADAKTQIAAALARAKKNNTRVLIQWGGNWCGWCIRLNELCRSDKALSRELMYEYEVVHVDAGQPKGKNIDLAKTYGADLEKAGFPFLTILDSSGKPLANQETEALEVKKNGESAGLEAGHDPAAVLGFLKSNEAKPLKAQDAYDAAIADAKKSGKRVFMHFGAPWCVWCHRLEDWMAQPAVAAILAKEFVDLKIDTDRMTGGSEMLDKTRGSKSGGIPWFAMIDDAGKAVVTSDGPNGNIGFPGAGDEIAHFESMLRKSARNLSGEEIDALIASLATKPKPVPGD
jgi:thiol:disulfide interchange protein